MSYYVLCMVHGTAILIASDITKVLLATIFRTYSPYHYVPYYLSITYPSPVAGEGAG
jgi:hypothetical protein